jgi:uncharacterized protein (TIGR03790 family)
MNEHLSFRRLVHHYGRALVLALAAATMLGGYGQARAEDGTAVVVVYNTNLPESKEVADYYAQRRNVPAEQIIGLSLTTTEAMSRKQYNETLLNPLLAALKERKLMQLRDQPDTNWVRVSEASFRYLLLCYGVPTKINPEAGLVERGTEDLRVELKRNESAVDSELACIPRGPYPITGFVTNRFYQATNSTLMQLTNGLLMVTRLDGPSASIAKGLVDLSIEGETNGLWGRVYIDLRGLKEGPYELGDEWLEAAGYVCRRQGLETVIDTNATTFPASFPMSQVAFYAGWYDANASGPFLSPKVEFMPGAFAYHLHSFSAETIRTTNLHWVGPLLAKGATATMGCVFEPYLTGTPDMSAFFSRFIERGFSFGEAAFESQVALSWQTIAVGDPLYRPFVIKPEMRHKGLAQKNSPLLEWAYITVVNRNLFLHRPRSDMLDFLRSLPLTKESAVLTEKRAELYMDQQQLSAALDVYNQVLKLKASPEQRKRVLLKVGEIGQYYGRNRESFEAYQLLVKEYPDYPDIATIYDHLVSLATDLNKPELAEEYRKHIKRATGGGGGH